MTIIKNMIKIAAIGFVSMVGLSGCNDSFMDKYSETSITEDGFFKTPGDLEIYTNNMYGYISADYWDVASDNVMYVEEAGIYSKMRGELNPNKAGAWSWGSIRNVNFMLARTNNVVGDVAEINHYIGLARMFRAKLYYDKVLSYSDVPWYSRDLQTTDTEELFKPQDPRALVVDSVMADLDFAVKNMKDNSSGRTRWYRSGALAMQARIALAEGCWRKYHPELGLNDADRFFKVAADACNAIMNTGNYELSVGEDYFRRL